MDKRGANTAAMDEINTRGETHISVRQVKYLNNIVEQDHRTVKRVTRPMFNFKSFRAAKCVLAGIELMHMIRKGPLMIKGRNEMSFAYHFMRWQGNPPGLRGWHSSIPKNVHQLATRQSRQYASHGFRDVLKEYGITSSMNRRGNCWDIQSCTAYPDTKFIRV